MLLIDGISQTTALPGRQIREKNPLSCPAPIPIT